MTFNSTAKIVILFSIILVGCGKEPEVSVSANSPESAIAPQDRTGALSFDNAYDINDVSKVRGDLWVLAKTYPQVSTICLFATTMLGTDKYGNPKTGKMLLVAEADELNELRKYQSINFAMENEFVLHSVGERTCPSEAVHLELTRRNQ